MGYNFSKLSLERLENIHPKLIELMKVAIIKSPHDFMITQGVRSAKYQNELYQKGRTRPGKIVTFCDGYIKKSNHQAKNDGYGYALDIAIYNPKIKSKLDYDEVKLKEVAAHIKQIAERLNIKISWGGDWKSFKDYPHFELKG
ncbi:M15 family metallopeptidase [Streptobacillus moniliformis]|uniref:M15 family metallopeptidase n=1 Tax=Streptobacillus moniliformis TaxID=34105 RepID=UPI0007E4729C|nr:M15 family metallopeptidase [Streptobacillus moniliformis]